ncbi:MAG TPA: D-alanyl-D-alanine carboxypeptidase family protein [Stellaceae bacterium]|nr:D-alanyl-D-alanine carboxypeptidase family protein [Stellaceae bacterium]
MPRVTSKRFVFDAVASLFAAIVFVWAIPAVQAKTESSIVIDGETGKVLSEHNADLPNYPASLTKMMTLYLLFESIEQGKIKLDQPFTVSRWAAAQAPSKLGLAEGQTIAVRDLVLAIVTKSANDAAVTVAENIAGSETAFAERMTQKARMLGMTSTAYRNASGLPHPAQLTTARDLVKLARALYRDFPHEYAYFATEEFTFNGITHVNHNHLMQSFEGMDGIKTGYIRASGFNLAASAVRDNRRLIGVVMGGLSAHGRDMEMARLLNAGFAGRDSAPVIVTAEREDDSDASANTLTHRTARAIAALSPVGRAEAATPVRLHRPHAETAERWSIQVGAFAQEAAAEKAAAAAITKLPTSRGKTAQVVAPGHTDKERYFRARILNFSQHEAEKACHALRKKHVDCAVVAPGAAQQQAAARFGADS